MSHWPDKKTEAEMMRVFEIVDGHTGIGDLIFSFESVLAELRKTQGQLDEAAESRSRHWPDKKLEADMLQDCKSVQEFNSFDGPEQELVSHFQAVLAELRKTQGKLDAAGRCLADVSFIVNSRETRLTVKTDDAKKRLADYYRSLKEKGEQP